MKTTIFSLLCFSVFFGLISCGTEQKTTSDETTSSESDQTISLTQEQQKSIHIETASLTQKPINNYIEVTGLLDVPPQNAISVSSIFGGYVLSTEMLQGKFVKKGQVLCEMQDPAYIQIQQEYLEAKSKFQFLKLDYERQLALAKEQANAQKTLQHIKSEYESIKAVMEAAKAKLAMLNISIASLEEGKITSTIKLMSPISGYVTQVNVNIGSYVQPKDIMFRIVDTEHLHAEIIVYEKDLASIQINQKVLVQLPNEDAVRNAHVYLINREIAADRSIRVHCHLDEEDPSLIPGTYIQAKIITNNKLSEAVPSSAIVSHEGQDYIFVSDNQHQHFQYFQVETLLSSDGWNHIKFAKNRPDSGAQVVTKGAYDLISKLKNAEEEE